MLLIERLNTHVPNTVLNQISTCTDQFEINTALRLAHFLAQCAHESGEFKVIEENLNYSPKRLKTVFPKYFPNNLAESYAFQPEKIASRVYGNRMGNGDEASKDGYKYRGRGYLQLTGKDNYNAFANAVNGDVLDNPDLVKSIYPLFCSAWFWNTNKLNVIADLGSTMEVVKKITRKINGGLNGLDERLRYFEKYFSLLK